MNAPNRPRRTPSVVNVKLAECIHEGTLLAEDLRQNTKRLRMKNDERETRLQMLPVYHLPARPAEDLEQSTKTLAAKFDELEARLREPAPYQRPLK